MASKATQALLDERNKVVADIRGVISRADAETKGVLTTEQRAEIERLEARESELTDSIEARVRLDEIERKLNANIDPNPGAGTGGANSEATEERKRKIQMEAFRAFIKHGPGAIFRSDEFRTHTAGSLTEGGALVAPQEFVTELLKTVDNKVVIRDIARKFQLTKAMSLGVPTLDTDLDDAEWVTELSTGSETSLKFGKRELEPKAMAKRVKISKKLLQVSAFPVEQLVRDRLAYKFGVTEEKAYMTGPGDKAVGVFVANANGISTARDVAGSNTTTAIKADTLIDTFESLKEDYQRNSTWVINRLVMREIRKLKDSNNQYLLQPGLNGGTLDTLLGRPVRRSEYAPSTMTAGQYVAVLGDFNYYWIAEALDIQIQRLDELYAETNEVGFIGRREVDGMPVLEEAFARVKMADS